MTSSMYKMVMAKKPDVELPTEFGKKWTELEEQQLLNELEIDMDCNTVAENHKRTLGGIRSHIYEMAYRMYLKNVPKDEIMKKMRLTEGHLDDIIARRTVKEDNKMKRKERKEPEEKSPQMNRPVLELVPPIQAEFNTVKTEIQQIKQDLTEIKTELKTFSKEMGMLKKSVGQMMVMIKQIYEFETEQ